ncbi:ABC transporter substrate-binding protein [Thauera sp. CAU 1555]|uniref:ABC transporter substrate-binding protein n=1 Tax=Thauera sedimentorum TaxID=2767595 RepID=A0ABR9BBS2_9RHOO|nr:ABC transporter substrate-binding protein [Thauera sedimentorum]MBC9071752.1 ABC transporter substrate-binding protein [Thauera sedimentorum]MBD8502671.1 ABC transporter substrate-binding protein [Thauera sedimentorum]
MPRPTFRFPLAARLRLLLACVLLGLVGATAAAEPAKLRVGVLKFGTVSWELDVIRHHGLDRKHGVALEVVELANKDATAIALQGGAVDMIVTDWLWVSRQRDAGADYTFVAYSEASGAVMVRPDGGIRSLADLAGKRIGVAGSALDKSWLLLRAHALRSTGRDLKDSARPAYAAPPLLNEKFLQGELDAVLNFWQYAARLEAQGMVPLIQVQDLLAGLGVPGRLPLIGYVFSERFAAAQPDAVRGFIAASRAAQAVLRDSDAEWTRLQPLTGAKDAATLAALRDGFRRGIPSGSAAEHQAAIAAAYRVLAETGGAVLVGESAGLARGTVWQGW